MAAAALSKPSINTIVQMTAVHVPADAPPPARAAAAYSDSLPGLQFMASPSKDAAIESAAALSKVTKATAAVDFIAALMNTASVTTNRSHNTNSSEPALTAANSTGSNSCPV